MCGRKREVNWDAPQQGFTDTEGNFGAGADCALFSALYAMHASAGRGFGFCQADMSDLREVFADLVWVEETGVSFAASQE